MDFLKAREILIKNGGEKKIWKRKSTTIEWGIPCDDGLWNDTSRATILHRKTFGRSGYFIENSFASCRLNNSRFSAYTIFLLIIPGVLI